MPARACKPIMVSGRITLCTIIGDRVRSTAVNTHLNHVGQPAVCLISLGCAKNHVDSERILGLLVQAGFLVAEDPADADICLVNTCGFLKAARTEVREVLAELSSMRASHGGLNIVALGCAVEMAKKHPGLEEVLREADVSVGLGEYDQLVAICLGLVGGEDRELLDKRPFGDAARLRFGLPHVAYLKISEGCSNNCAYCAIPQIRGPRRSVPLEALVEEAQNLIQSGARELDLIAQDTGEYGRDLYGEPRLAELLKQLHALDGAPWIRVLYTHPAHVRDDLLAAMHTLERVCPYLDVPLQHSNERVLKAMERPYGPSVGRELIARIRRLVPGVALRTTFIVGFPGETEAEFEELCAFVAEGHFMHMGAFAYSEEPGTGAAGLADNVAAGEKASRVQLLMDIQRDVSRAHLAEWSGKLLEVMLDDVDRKDSTAWGRAVWQAPDVDGGVFLYGNGIVDMHPGEIIRAAVTDTSEYDLSAIPKEE